MKKILDAIFLEMVKMFDSIKTCHESLHSWLASYIDDIRQYTTKTSYVTSFKNHSFAFFRRLSGAQT